MDLGSSSDRSRHKTPRPEGLYGFSNPHPDVEPSLSPPSTADQYQEIDIGYAFSSGTAQNSHPEVYSEFYSSDSLPSSYAVMDPGPIFQASRDRRPELEPGYPSSSRSAANADIEMNSGSSGSYRFLGGHRQDTTPNLEYSPQTPRSNHPEFENGYASSSQSPQYPHPGTYVDVYGSYSSPGDFRQEMNPSPAYSSRLPRNDPEVDTERGTSSRSTQTSPELYSEDVYAMYDLPTVPQPETNENIYYSAKSVFSSPSATGASSYNSPRSLTDRHQGMRADPDGLSSFPPYQQSELQRSNPQYLGSLRHQSVETEPSIHLSRLSLRNRHADRPHGIPISHHRRHPAMSGGLPPSTNRYEEAYELQEQQLSVYDKPLPPRPDSPWPFFIASPSTSAAPKTPRTRMPTNSDSEITIQNNSPGMAMAMEIGGAVLKELAELGELADAATEAAVLYGEPRTALQSIKSIFQPEPTLFKSVRKLKDFIVIVNSQAVDKSLFRGIENKAVKSSCMTMYPKFEAMAARLKIVSRNMTERKSANKKRMREMTELLEHVGELHFILERMICAIEAYIEKKLEMWELVLEEFREIRTLLKQGVGMILPGQIVQDEETKKIAQELSGVGNPHSPQSTPGSGLPQNAERYLALEEAYSPKEMPHRTLIPISPTHTALTAGFHEPFTESVGSPSQSADQLPAWSPRGPGQRLSETDIADARIIPDNAPLDWQEIQYGNSSGTKALRI